MLSYKKNDFFSDLYSLNISLPISKNHYYPFTVKKRNGSVRNLVNVQQNLKDAQDQVREFLEVHFPISKYAHGFISNLYLESNSEKTCIRHVGVISNAYSHTNKKLVISIDLNDFFPSIIFPRVLGMLMKSPFEFSRIEAAFLANLICLPKDIDKNRGLPQGSPSSPIISNLICNKLDYQLGRFAAKHDITYTRYADDLTFSTNNIRKMSAQFIIEKVTEHVQRNGFSVNEAKTKVMYRNHRQMVTGIVVNEGLNLHKKHVDALRATLYNLEHKFLNTESAIAHFWQLDEKAPYGSVVPIIYDTKDKFFLHYHNHDFYKVNQRQIKFIYARHLLSRIEWYGQVVTTGIDEPYDLDNRYHISERQLLRIKRYEEMLAAFSRISIKLGWQVDHIIQRRMKKLNYLNSLVLMDTPQYKLETSALDDLQQGLLKSLSAIDITKENLIKYVMSAPVSFKRSMIVDSRKTNYFLINDVKEKLRMGWVDPKVQQAVLEEFDNKLLSDIFHTSDDGKGYLVKKLLINLVEKTRPHFKYLSKNIQKKIRSLYNELYKIVEEHPNDLRFELNNNSDKTERLNQATLDLKNSIRISENKDENFYTKIISPALESSRASSFFDVDKSDMDSRYFTDIDAWQKSLTKLFVSIVQHKTKPEDLKFTIVFCPPNPVTNEGVMLKIYTNDLDQIFKKKLNISNDNESTGYINKWLLGADLTQSIQAFLPVGDIYVHGGFKDMDGYTVNLTEHSYIKEEVESHEKYGKLLFTIKGII